jgi:hypothetical protein
MLATLERPAAGGGPVAERSVERRVEGARRTLDGSTCRHRPLFSGWRRMAKSGDGKVGLGRKLQQNAPFMGKDACNEWDGTPGPA